VNIRFSLNGVSSSIDAEPGERLAVILRDRFHLKGAKCACLQGRCGVCAVMLNGSLVTSCLVPAFSLNGAKIVTFEGFSKTDNYRDIEAGFAAAPVKTCGYCYSAKVLAAESVLISEKKLTRQRILPAFSGIRCSCTNPGALVEGVLAACDFRKQRLNERGFE
jgi:carbon-monoxide dehydrogenase small subunit